nr:serine/arginine repetitive matrix protein 1-like [Aegilops tauschii subsp. strangulata]
MGIRAAASHLPPLLLRHLALSPPPATTQRRRQVSGDAARGHSPCATSPSRAPTAAARPSPGQAREAHRSPRRRPLCAAARSARLPGRGALLAWLLPIVAPRRLAPPSSGSGRARTTSLSCCPGRSPEQLLRPAAILWKASRRRPLLLLLLRFSPSPYLHRREPPPPPLEHHRRRIRPSPTSAASSPAFQALPEPPLFPRRRRAMASVGLVGKDGALAAATWALRPIRSPSKAQPNSPQPSPASGSARPASSSFWAEAQWVSAIFLARGAA